MTGHLHYPKEWSLKRLGSCLRQIQRPIRRVPNGRYQPLGVRSHGRGLFFKESLAGAELGASNFFSLLPGDFVFSQQFAWEGAVAVAEDEHEGCIVSHRFPVFCGTDTNLRYLARLFGSPLGLLLLEENSYGAAGRNKPLNLGTLLKEKVPFPPLATQTAIADFLDRKTATIDALIEKKERMIELLDEKRAALVHRAVTKGLGPDVPLKDSGVPWIGEIPVHWKVLKVGWQFAIGNGSTPNRQRSDYWGGEIPWLNSGKVNQGVIKSSDQFVTKLAVNECHLPMVKPGSVLVAITGEGQTRGRAALLTRTATLSQHLAYLTPRSDHISSEFLRFVFGAAYSWLRSESSGIGSTRAALTCDYLRGFKLAAPPLEEQLQIETDIKVQVKRDSEIAAQIGKQIDRLKEYRQALITQAVTGQLKIPTA